MNEQLVEVLGILLFGLGLYLLYPIINNAINNIKIRSQYIKSYWKYIGGYILIAVSGYLGIFTYVGDVIRSDIIGIWNTAISILLAIFLGYYAFIQLVDSKARKLKEEGDVSIYNRPNYLRAIGKYEEARKYDPSDVEAICILLEHYLLIRDHKKFNDLLESTKIINCIVGDEVIILQWLAALRFLLDRNVGIGEQLLGGLVEHRKREGVFLKGYWSFEQFRNSDTYKSLKNDEVKLIIDNAMAYLENKLTPENLKKFEEGNFTLK